MKFYAINSKSYAESTFNEDFAKAVFAGMKKIISVTNKDNPILDIGCGSGRDANYLSSLGYKVHAYDQSPEMINEAKRLTNLENVFNVGSAQLFHSETKYNFAYSIACLLHLNDLEFELAINNIAKHLNEGGVFYFTLKKGQGEEVDQAGRYFNYYTEEKLKSLFLKLDLFLVNVTENQDLTRPDTTWLNVIVGKPA